MTLELEGIIADVILSFQKRPGVDDDSIINAGDARRLDTNGIVPPQGKGYYCLKMAEGDTCELELLGSKYRIVNEPKEILETKKDDLTITSWKVLGDNTKNGGVRLGVTPGLQRRLQILGYYSAAVDGNMGEATENAILNFQADNGLRADGVAGDDTRTKLNNLVESGQCKSKDTYVIRQSLIRFTRAPSATDPKAASGWPSVHAPEIDDRGFLKAKALGFEFAGPVTTIQPKRDFRIKVVRERIAIEATLIAKSTDDNLVDVPTSPLPNTKEIILELKSKELSEKKAKSAEIKILCKSGAKDIEIGSLLVIVLPTIPVAVQPYWVTISSQPPGGGPPVHPTPPSKSKDDFTKAFNIANAIWAQYGIHFNFRPWKEKSVGLTTAGLLGSRTEFEDGINALDSTNNPSTKTVINLLIVNKLDGDDYGVSYDALTNTWPCVGVALKWDSEHGLLSTGINLAHEFGHFLSLARTISAHKWYTHADDDSPDPNVSRLKNDIWSFKQLLVGRWPKDVRPGEAWAHHYGYGHNLVGCLVAIKDLPEVSSRTDNACHNARKWAANKKKLYG